MIVLLFILPILLKMVLSESPVLYSPSISSTTYGSSLSSPPSLPPSSLTVTPSYSPHTQYGPPSKAPIIHKHVYVHVPPPEPEYIQSSHIEFSHINKLEVKFTKVKSTTVELTNFFCRREHTPCRAVMLTASAIKVDYVLENVDMTENKHLKNEKLLKHNELAKVPVLLIGSGDKSIADSHAINPYLIDEHRSKDDSLYPKDPYKRAKIDRMLHFDSAELFPRLDALFRTQCYTKNLEPLKPDHIKNFLEVLSILEKMLEKKKYLCEDHLTLADLTCVATVSSAIGVVTEIQENKYKNVLNWVKRLEELPYYQAANGAGAKELRDYVNKRLQAYEDSTKAA